MAQLKLILCPVDLSPRCDPVIDFAEFCAERFGAAIDLLHVRRPDLIVHGTDAPISLQAFSDTELSRRMKRYMEETENRGIRCRGRLECGIPEKIILEVAAREPYDLIVMGTHGRTGIAHLLKGSLTESVVRHAPCPVLSVRVPEEVIDIPIPTEFPFSWT